jgi:hypothetical protein
MLPQRGWPRDAVGNNSVVLARCGCGRGCAESAFEALSCDSDSHPMTIQRGPVALSTRR